MKVRGATTKLVVFAVITSFATMVLYFTIGNIRPGTVYRTYHAAFGDVTGLLPGTYNLKVSAPSFLPALREKVGLRPGAKLMVNVTLTTLFEAIQLGPLRGPADDDDWKWTLRSVANRSILRVLPDGTTAIAREAGSERDGTARQTRSGAPRIARSTGLRCTSSASSLTTARTVPSRANGPGSYELWRNTGAPTASTRSYGSSVSRSAGRTNGSGPAQRGWSCGNPAWPLNGSW